jgi:hypothetical protein
MLFGFTSSLIEVGQFVDIYAGCSHQPDDCQNKFNNLINFLGFQFIPQVNAFRSGVE